MKITNNNTYTIGETFQDNHATSAQYVDFCDKHLTSKLTAKLMLS